MALIYVDIVLNETASSNSPLIFDLRITTKRPIQIISGKVVFFSDGVWLKRNGHRTGDGQYVKRELLIDSQGGPQPFGRFFVQPPQIGAAVDAAGDAGTETKMIAEAGKGMTITVRLNLPDNLPDSWNYRSSGNFGRTRSTLDARVSYRRLDKDPLGIADSDGEALAVNTIAAELVVPVKNVVPVERFGRNLITGEDAKTATVGIPFHKNWIYCGLKCENILGLLGSALLLVVQINNKSPRVLHRVSLSLYQEITFKEKAGFYFVPMSVSKERLSKRRLPSIKPYRFCHLHITDFVMPADCLTSGSLAPCSFVSLRFFVQLKVQWRYGCKKCDVTIHLGSHRTDSSGS